MPALCSTRRHFLRASPFGLGGLALPWLLSRENLLAAPVKPDFDRVHDLAPRPPPGFGKARAMISLFMIGGPSQMDLCDPKPELTKRHLQPFPGEIKYDNAAEASKKVFGSPFRFAPRGRCGMEISDLMPGLASIADEITLIRSMRTGVSNHGQSMYALHAGRIVSGHPVLGSWLSYGLGSLSDELPAFVTLTDPRGPPLLQHDNWSAGYLPAVYQGTLLRPTDPRLLNLDPPPICEGNRKNASWTSCANSTNPTQPPVPANPTCTPASRASNWPPACRPGPRRPSTFPTSRLPSKPCTASTRRSPATGARAA